MPFLTTSSPTFCPTKFYIVHEASPHLGTNILIQKMAAVFFKQKKKVLIFDALLGLKNMPINNKNQSKIPAVFKRQLPISELITHEKGIDIISGVSCQNFTALTSCQQQYIKASLQQLAHNYDIVLINVPFQITDSIWDDMGENLWVISEKKEIIRKTLLQGIIIVIPFPRTIHLSYTG